MFHKKIYCLAIISALFSAQNAQAESSTYKLDKMNTNVTWHANNGFIVTNGKLTNVEGTLILDERRPAHSQLTVTIRMDSVQTGWDEFNKVLTGEGFFNVAKFPEATFVSEKIEMRGRQAALVHGNLTFLGVTKPVFMNVRLNKVGKHPMDNTRTAGFSGTLNVRRSEFGMTTMLDKGAADDVRIEIQAEAKKQGGDKEK